MASNKPKTTGTTPRVPPPIDNNNSPLGVPGSLNEPLRGARRRQQARRRGRNPSMRWIKPLLMVMGVLTFFGVVALVIFLILFPPYFRSNIEPRYQQRIIEFFPWATYWMPTLPFQYQPTPVDSTGQEQAFQLMTQAAMTAAAPSLTPAATDLPGAGELPSATPTPSPTGASEGGIPAGLAPTFTPTDLPNAASPTPNLQPTWTPAYVPTEMPLPSYVKLEGVRYEMQDWNNCGPTTMTMALSYFGWSDNQYVAAKWMKPGSEDKNVSPWQMVRFVNENTTNIRALYRYGGNIQLLKKLLAANFPVIIEESISPAEHGWMGHYVLLVGYNDANQEFLSYDSYLGYNNGNGRSNPYTLLDESWRHFNRVFIVVYDPSRELELRQVLGDYVDPNYANEVALDIARQELGRNIEDKWAWFNAGTSYVALHDYESAAIAFDQAFRLKLPFRMLWYQFGPFEAYYRTGRYNDVLAQAQGVLGSTKYVEEVYYWQGMVYAAQGNMDAAISNFNLALRYNSNFFPAQEAKAQVETGSFQAALANN